MHINIGDKLVVTKNVSGFFNEGDIVEVTNVNENVVSFACYDTDTEDHIRIERSGKMDIGTCNQYFMKLEEKEENTETPAITEEYVAEILDNSEFEICTMFDKCTVVSCRLPNGFVIAESSACVSPENYDEEVGAEICVNKIADKVWELEAYRLQQHLWEESMKECSCCCEECEEPFCDCEDDCNECFYSDLDCDDCEDYECEFNPNR